MKVNETILLLGGTGFIGKNLIDYYVNNSNFSKFQFIVLSRKVQKQKNANIIYEKGDYCDKSVLRNLFKKWNFSKVFHFASSTTPVSSNQNILDDLNGNLIATIHLLEVMREFKCNYILYLSSGGAVYGEKKTEFISENVICSPVSSYGVVKLTIENYLKLYQKQYGIDYLILRVSNPFGAFHVSESQGIINIAIRRALKGQSLEVWGDGSQSKDYIYISDLIQIIATLLDNNILNLVLNVGSGKTYQLNEILKKIKSNLPHFEIQYIESKPTDIKDFCLDVSLLKSLIDFEFTAFEEAIKKTIIYEKKQLSNL